MRARRPLTMLLFVWVAVLAVPALAAKGEPKADPAVPKVPTFKPAYEILASKAADALHHDQLADAATFYCDIQLLYPERPEAEDALWQCADLRRKIAASATAPDWQGVKDTFRRFIAFYPKSPRLPRSYLEVGKAYARIKFYREAVSYFRLFLDQFADSPLAAEAQRRLGKALVKIGRLDEAEKLFSGWALADNPRTRAIGLTGMGDVRFAQGRLTEARKFYQRVLITTPEYAIDDPTVLDGAGQVNLRLGRTAEGREQLYHYLSLGGVVSDRVAVLFALAESYYRQGSHTTAAGLYRMISDLAEPGSRAAVISALRLAQYRDDKEGRVSKWEQGGDLTDPAGDAPYLRTLERFIDDPRAQDARYGLFRRYQARGDLEHAAEMGRNFLRDVPKGADDLTTRNRVGTILLYLVEEYLAAKRYQDIYDLYFVEYRHVKDYPDARLLYMIGQAMEGLGLLDQAAVVYYRAMKWPLPAPLKKDLYFRRARVYLAKKDLDAADRLLTYLRKLYARTEFIGAVRAYSARLAEARGDREGALTYYEQAFAAPTYPERRGEHAAAAMRLALDLGRPEQALALARKWAAAGTVKPVDAFQKWLLAAGNAFREQKQWQRAADCYTLALERKGGRPQRLQALRLYLGDSYAALGRGEEAEAQYTEVEKGPDSPWKKLAAARKKGKEIDRAARKAAGVLNGG